MKKFMLVGAVSAGKTSLMQAIYGQDLSYQKTQAIDFKDNIIDTPVSAVTVGGTLSVRRGSKSAMSGSSSSSTNGCLTFA